MLVGSFQHHLTFLTEQKMASGKVLESKKWIKVQRITPKDTTLKKTINSIPISPSAYETNTYLFISLTLLQEGSRQINDSYVEL